MIRYYIKNLFVLMIILSLSTPAMAACTTGVQVGTTLYIGNCQNLTELNILINNVSALQNLGGGEWLLNAKLWNNNTANTFYINDTDVTWLKINSTYPVSWQYYTQGKTEINNTKITSWNTTLGNVENLSAITWVRSSIESSGASAKMNISNSNVSYLGYNVAEKYGVSYLSSGSVISNSVFLNNYRGIYASGSGMVISNVTATSTFNDPLYLDGSDNNVINNFTGISTQNNGIAIYNGANGNTITDSIGISSSDDGVAISTSSNNNTLTNVSGISSTGNGIIISSSENNSMNGGSYYATGWAASSVFSYQITNSVSNIFNNTNFTVMRRIFWSNNISVFSYRNGSDVLLNSSLNITPTNSGKSNRTIYNWNSSNITFSEKFNDGGGRKLNYNISGLSVNTDYKIWNGSNNDFNYTSDSNGVLQMFWIYFPANSEVTVKVLEQSSSLPDGHDCTSGLGTSSYNSSNNTITLGVGDNTICTIYYDVNNVSILSYNSTSTTYTLNTTINSSTSGATNLNISDADLYINSNQQDGINLTSGWNLTLHNTTITSNNSYRYFLRCCRNTGNGFTYSISNTEIVGGTLHLTGWDETASVSNNDFGDITDLTIRDINATNQGYLEPYGDNPADTVLLLSGAANRNATITNVTISNATNVVPTASAYGGILYFDDDATNMTFTNITIINSYSGNTLDSGKAVFRWFGAPSKLTINGLNATNIRSSDNISGDIFGDKEGSYSVVKGNYRFTNLTFYNFSRNGYWTYMNLYSCDTPCGAEVENIIIDGVTPINFYENTNAFKHSGGGWNPMGESLWIFNATIKNVYDGFDTVYGARYHVTNLYTENISDKLVDNGGDGDYNGEVNLYYLIDINVTDSSGIPMPNTIVTFTANGSSVNTTLTPMIVDKWFNNRTSTQIITLADGHTPLPSNETGTVIALVTQYYNSGINVTYYSYTVTINDASKIYTNKNTSISNTGINTPIDIVASTTITPNSSWYRPEPNTYQNTTTIQLPTSTNWSILPDTTIYVNASSDKNLTATWSGSATVLFNTTIPEWASTTLYLKHDGSTVDTKISNGTGFVSFTYTGINGDFNVSNESILMYNVSGYVNDTYGSPINSVSIVNGTNSTNTNATGYYNLSMSNGTYNFTYSKSGYVTNYREITISGTNVSNQNVTLTSQPSCSANIAYSGDMIQWSSGWANPTCINSSINNPLLFKSDGTGGWITNITIYPNTSDATLYINSSDTNIFTLSNSSDIDVDGNIEIKDITMSGNTLSNIYVWGTWSGSVNRVVNITNVIFNNLGTDTFPDYGLTIYGISYVNITNSSMNNMAYGSWIKNSGGLFNNNTIFNSSQQGIWDESSFVQISNNNINRTLKDGIFVLNSTNKKINNNMISNSGYQTGVQYNGIFLEGEAENGITVENNTIDNTTNAGVYIDTGQNNTIRNNMILNVPDDGIIFYNNASYNIAENNSINSTRFGIYFANSARHNIVQNNSISGMTLPINFSETYPGLDIGTSAEVGYNTWNNTVKDIINSNRNNIYISILHNESNLTYIDSSNRLFNVVNHSGTNHSSITINPSNTSIFLTMPQGENNTKYRYWNLTKLNASAIPQTSSIIRVESWNSTYKLFNSSAPTNYTIGDNPVNTLMQIKTNGSNWQTNTSNSTGYINFNFTTLGETQFEIENYTAPQVYAPNITAWWNSINGWNQTTMSINAGNSATFNITVNQTVTNVSWKVAGAEEQNTSSLEFTRAFNTLGDFNVTAQAFNANGSSNIIYTVVTVTTTGGGGTDWDWVYGWVKYPNGTGIYNAVVYTSVGNFYTDSGGYYSAGYVFEHGLSYNFNITKSGFNWSNQTIAFSSGDYQIVNATIDVITPPQAWLPNITSWGNTNTSNVNTSLTVSRYTNITFNITANQSVTTTWSGTASPTKINGTDSNESYAFKNFTSAGSYTVIASCSNTNGSCLNSVTWTITVTGIGGLTLSGYVINALDIPLEQARIDFNGGYNLTDTNGYYLFSNVTEGTYAVLARAIGYRNSTSTSTISQNTTINFTLSERTSGSVSAPGFEWFILVVVIVLLYFRKKKYGAIW